MVDWFDFLNSTRIGALAGTVNLGIFGFLDDEVAIQHHNVSSSNKHILLLKANGDEDDDG